MTLAFGNIKKRFS